MRAILFSLLVVAACGPTPAQVHDTPSALKQYNNGEAPPASNADDERWFAIREFDDMEDAQLGQQQARAEHAQPPRRTPPPASPPGELQPKPEPVQPR